MLVEVFFYEKQKLAMLHKVFVSLKKMSLIRVKSDFSKIMQRMNGLECTRFFFFKLQT